jgi:diguanylate cyclase (GGDEF)-like protein
VPHGLPHSPTPPPEPRADPATATPAEQGTARDFVTGLEPRGVLEARLAKALPAREPLAMVIVDVVGMKAVNEREGFLAGDTLLRAAADRLRAAAPDADILARLGGDELVAVFLGGRAAAAAARAAGGLAAATTRPALRAAALEARPQETAAELVERLYATLRRC